MTFDPFLCLLAFLISFSLFASNPTRPNNDFAIFFANDNYAAHPNFDNLRNPVKDAKAIAKELNDVYGFEIFIYENLSKTEVYQTLGEWQAKTFEENSQLFVFFSGHGAFWDFTGTGYFVPKTNKADYESYIELKILGSIISKFNCDHILLAIDACYSGTIDSEIAFRGKPSGINNEREIFVMRQFRNKSRLLITSGGKERTPDGDEHSPFSWAIISGLRGAYTNSDGLFTYQDLLAQLERIPSPIPHEGKLIGHEGGGFVFIAEKKEQALRNFGNSDSFGETKDAFTITKEPNSILDRGGNLYSVQLMNDGKTWTTQNLNLDVSGSFCYNNRAENCTKYGRLYTWEAAKEACESLGGGWRLPLDSEWRALAKEFGGTKEDSRDKGKKAHREMMRGGSSNFNALLGGWQYADGSFRYLHKRGGYWTANEYGDNEAINYNFSTSGSLFEAHNLKSYGRSVRCVKD